MAFAGQSNEWSSQLPSIYDRHMAKEAGYNFTAHNWVINGDYLLARMWVQIKDQPGQFTPDVINWALKRTNALN